MRLTKQQVEGRITIDAELFFPSSHYQQKTLQSLKEQKKAPGLPGVSTDTAHQTTSDYTYHAPADGDNFTRTPRQAIRYLEDTYQSGYEEDGHDDTDSGLTNVQAEKQAPLRTSGSDLEILELADIDLNGRQIENVVKASRSLARRLGKSLSIDEVRRCWRLCMLVHFREGQLELILELLLRVRGLKYLSQRLQLAIHIEGRPGYVCGQNSAFLSR